MLAFCAGALEVMGAWQTARHLLALERAGSPTDRRPNMWLRGFFSAKAWLYPFAEFPYELFLTDMEIETRLSSLNSPAWRAAFKDKAAAHALFTERLAFIGRPDVLGMWEKGRAEIEVPFAAVAKPLQGRGGQGVELLEPGAHPSGAGPYLLERLVTGHDYGRSIFPGSLNTVRLYTAKKKDEEPFLLGSVHRFGTSRSVPVDNFKAGGIVSLIAPDTGALTAAVSSQPSATRKMHTHHPETLAVIEGVRVPGWTALKGDALKAAKAFPELRYAAWDFAVSTEGVQLIEVNTGLPNPNLVQMHQPLLLSEQARRFFFETGVISERKRRRAEAASSGR